MKQIFHKLLQNLDERSTYFCEMLFVISFQNLEDIETYLSDVAFNCSQKLTNPRPF